MKLRDFRPDGTQFELMFDPALEAERTDTVHRRLADNEHLRRQWRQLWGVLEAIRDDELPPAPEAKADRYTVGQVPLQQLIRERLTAAGWLGLATKQLFETNFGPTQADMVSDPLSDPETPGLRIPARPSDRIHLLLVFGNHQMFWEKLMTRALPIDDDHARLTVFVTPTRAFGKMMDSGLTSYEDVTRKLKAAYDTGFELGRPFAVLGVRPEQLTGDPASARTR